MDDAAERALTSLFAPDGDRLERIALRARELSDAPEYDVATTSQFLRGFAAIVSEAMAGESRDARELYNASAVQVLTAEGRPAAALAGQLVTFAMLLAQEVGAGGEQPEARAAAVGWLAVFMGEWTRELLDALEAARA